jgi:hypothetical protein
MLNMILKLSERWSEIGQSDVTSENKIIETNQSLGG